MSRRHSRSARSASSRRRSSPTPRADQPDAIKGATRILEEAAHQFDIVDAHSDLSPFSVVILPDTIPVRPSSGGQVGRLSGPGRQPHRHLRVRPEARRQRLRSGCVGREQGRRRPARRRRQSGARSSSMTAAIMSNTCCPAMWSATDCRPPSTSCTSAAWMSRPSPAAEVLAEIVPSRTSTARGSTSARTATRHRAASRQPGHRAQRQCDLLQQPDLHPSTRRWRRSGASGCCSTRSICCCPSRWFATMGRPRCSSRSTTRRPESPGAASAPLHPGTARSIFDIIEDVIPLYDVAVSVRVEGPVASVSLVPQGEAVDFSVEDGRVDFIVPKIDGHQMVDIQF